MAALVLATRDRALAGGLAPAATLLVFEAGACSSSSNRRFGGAPISWLHVWVPFALPVVAPAQLGYGLISKRIDWRGRAYDLDAHARLA